MIKQHIFFVLLFSLTISLSAMHPEQPIDPNPPLTGQKRKAQDLVDANAKKAAVTSDEFPLELIRISNTCRRAQKFSHIMPFPDEIWERIFRFVFQDKKAEQFVRSFKALSIAQGKTAALLLKDKAFNRKIAQWMERKYDIKYLFSTKSDERFHIQPKRNAGTLLSLSILNTPGSRLCIETLHRETIKGTVALFVYLIDQINLFPFSYNSAFKDLIRFKPAITSLLKFPIEGNEQISIPLEQQQLYLSLGIPIYELPTSTPHPLQHYQRRMTYAEQAVYHTDAKRLHQYLSFGFDLNKHDEKGHTLLHQLVIGFCRQNKSTAPQNCASIIRKIQLLKEHGANLALLNAEHQCTPHDLALQAYNGLLLQKNAINACCSQLQGEINQISLQLSALPRPARTNLNNVLALRQKQIDRFMQDLNENSAQSNHWQQILYVLDPNNPENQQPPIRLYEPVTHAPLELPLAFDFEQ